MDSFLDAQDHFPFADDSTAVTPMSEENGGVIVQPNGGWSRRNSYTSHGSYGSHGGISECNSRTRDPRTWETKYSKARMHGEQTLVPEVREQNAKILGNFWIFFVPYTVDI